MVKSRWSDRNQALATVSWNNLNKSMSEPLVLDELNLMFQGQNIINLNKLSSRNILLGLTFCFAVRKINCFQLRKTVKQIASFKNNLLFNIQFIVRYLKNRNDALSMIGSQLIMFMQKPTKILHNKWCLL